MKQIWIGWFAGTHLKSALCNLKSAILAGAMLFALSASAEAPQTEAKVSLSPVRAEILLSNSEQQPFPNQHKFETRLTHDLSHVAGLVTRRQDLDGRTILLSSR